MVFSCFQWCSSMFHAVLPLLLRCSAFEGGSRGLSLDLHLQAIQAKAKVAIASESEEAADA